MPNFSVWKVGMKKRHFRSRGASVRKCTVYLPVVIGTAVMVHGEGSGTEQSGDYYDDDLDGDGEVHLLRLVKGVGNELVEVLVLTLLHLLWVVGPDSRLCVNRLAIHLDRERDEVGVPDKESGENVRDNRSGVGSSKAFLGRWYVFT